MAIARRSTRWILLTCAAVSGTLYVAGTDNPAFLGPDDPDALAEHINRAQGASGSNTVYLLKLDEALRKSGETDRQVADLARRILGVDDA